MWGVLSISPPAFEYPRRVELFWTALLIVAVLAGTGFLSVLALRLHPGAGR
jgi:hypothetical protein